MNVKLIQDLKPYEPVTAVSQDMSIKAMVELLLAKPAVRYFCVLDEDGKLIGLIGRKRLFKGVFSHNVSKASMVYQLYTLVTSESASDLLIRNVVMVKETDKLDNVIEMMIERDLYQIPVVSEEKKILGFVCMDMILKEWLSELEQDKK